MNKYLTFVRGPVSIRLTACAFLLVGLAITKPQASPLNGCPATHGYYTSVLCNGDDLITNQYLVSPNGNLRLYLHYTMVTYDTTTDPYTVVREFYSGYAGAAYRFRTKGSWFELWDNTDATILSNGLDRESGGYLKFENDGCLHYYLSDGTESMSNCDLQ